MLAFAAAFKCSSRNVRARDSNRDMGATVPRECGHLRPTRLHPMQVQTLLSDVVSRYKQRMNAEGFHVWNWSETNEVKETDGGAAGNYYYGGSAHACELDENASLTEILAESLNIEQGAASLYMQYSPCLKAAVHVVRGPQT